MAVNVLINHTNDIPDHQLKHKILSSPSLLISQHSNHASPCKVGFMRQD